MTSAILNSLKADVAARNASQKTLKDFVAKAADHSERRSTEAVAVKDAPKSYRRRFTFGEADAAVAALPEGTYALARNTPDSAGNMTTLFRVFTKTNRSGVKSKRIVQLIANGTFAYTEKPLSVDHQVYAARHIGEDVKGALARYGNLTSTCGLCGRPLSNDESVALGIGSKCIKKL